MNKNKNHLQGQPNYLSIKVWINETAPRAIIADSSGNFGFTAFINDVRNMTDFTTYGSLFDQYRVIEQRVRYDPCYASSTGGTVQPGWVIAYDVDNTGSSSNLTPGTAATINRQGGPFPFVHNHSTSSFCLSQRFRLPKKADSIIDSTTLLSLPGSWTNCQSGAGNNGGYYCASIAATAASRPIGFVFSSWLVEFAYKYS